MTDHSFKLRNEMIHLSIPAVQLLDTLVSELMATTLGKMDRKMERIPMNKQKMNFNEFIIARNDVGTEIFVSKCSSAKLTRF